MIRALRAYVIASIICAVAMGLAPALAQSPDDARWDDRFAPVEGLSITALAVHGDDLYISGEFTSVDGVPASRIARWNRNSRTWSPLGSGLQRSATALAIWGDDLYVGGRMDSAGGLRVGGVARWSMSQRKWVALGAGVKHGATDAVLALAVDDRGLYAGGLLTDTANGGIRRNLMRWDLVAGSWSYLADSMPGTVRALALLGDSLYVGSDRHPFNGLAGGAAIGLVRRSRTSGAWAAVGDGLRGKAGSVRAMRAHDGKLYVGGTFNLPGVDSATGIAAYDPAIGGWSPMPGELRGGVYDLADDIDAIYVVGWGPGKADSSYGRSIVMRWDLAGREWKELGENDGLLGGGSGSLIAAGGGTFYAAGNFWRVGSVYAPQLAAWDAASGTWYSPLSSLRGFGLDAPVHALLPMTEGVYAGGDFTRAGLVGVHALALLRGDEWEGVSSGELVDGRVRALLAGDGGYYVGGLGFESIGSRSRLSWHDPAHGTWKDIGHQGIDIRALASLRGSIYAGVSSEEWTTPAREHLTRWTRDQEPPDLPPQPDSSVAALASAETNLYVGGSFAKVGKVTAPGIARWDGDAWWDVGGGVSGGAARVNAIAVVDGTDPAGHARLYIGGDFTMAGSLPARNVAYWDGALWHAVGDGVDGEVRSLLLNGKDLYAGGDFTHAGAVAANHIAIFRDNGWSALGSGVDGTVRALAAVGDDLIYAGGDFTHAGGRPSAHIALWHDQVISSAPSDGDMTGTVRSGATPNPASAATAIGFTLPASGHARLVVTASDGREIAVLVDAELPAGAHRAVWDASALPSGPYFYRLLCGGHIESGSVVVIH
jgi:hypothetical protein